MTGNFFDHLGVIADAAMELLEGEAIHPFYQGIAEEIHQQHQNYGQMVIGPSGITITYKTAAPRKLASAAKQRTVSMRIAIHNGILGVKVFPTFESSPAQITTFDLADPQSLPKMHELLAEIFP